MILTPDAERLIPNTIVLSIIKYMTTEIIFHLVKNSLSKQMPRRKTFRRSYGANISGLH